MYYSVKKVEAGNDYSLYLIFENGEQKIFSVKPYLNSGIFRKLKDITIFNSVKLSFDTVSWGEEIDFDPETLFEESILIG